MKRLLSKLAGPHWLAACLRYGSGLRLMECLRLRVKDLDFGHRAVIVRDGKGEKDRVVTLPDELLVVLRCHLEYARNLRNLQRKDNACPRPAEITRRPESVILVRSFQDMQEVRGQVAAVWAICCYVRSIRLQPTEGLQGFVGIEGFDPP